MEENCNKFEVFADLVWSAVRHFSPSKEVAENYPCTRECLSETPIISSNGENVKSQAKIAKKIQKHKNQNFLLRQHLKNLSVSPIKPDLGLPTESGVTLLLEDSKTPSTPQEQQEPSSETSLFTSSPNPKSKTMAVESKTDGQGTLPWSSSPPESSEEEPECAEISDQNEYGADLMMCDYLFEKASMCGLLDVDDMFPPEEDESLTKSAVKRRHRGRKHKNEVLVLTPATQKEQRDLENLNFKTAPAAVRTQHQHPAKGPTSPAVLVQQADQLITDTHLCNRRERRLADGTNTRRAPEQGGSATNTDASNSTVDYGHCEDIGLASQPNSYKNFNVEDARRDSFITPAKDKKQFKTPQQDERIPLTTNNNYHTPPVRPLTLMAQRSAERILAMKADVRTV